MPDTFRRDYMQPIGYNLDALARVQVVGLLFNNDGVLISYTLHYVRVIIEKIFEFPKLAKGVLVIVSALRNSAVIFYDIHYSSPSLSNTSSHSNQT